MGTTTQHYFQNIELSQASSKHKIRTMGLIPFVIDDPTITKKISTVHVGDSISSLNKLIAQAEMGQTIVFHLSPEAEAPLMRMQNSIAPLPVTRMVGINQIISIVETVRGQVFNWALALEEKGILGEGLTFTSKEKEIAEQSVTINNIENFQGVLGNVSDSNVTQTNHLVVNSNDFNSLAEHLRSQEVEQQDIAELHQAISNDPAPTQPDAFGSHVSAWMGKMITKAADGSWNVGVSAAGGLLATALGKYYGLL